MSETLTYIGRDSAVGRVEIGLDDVEPLRQLVVDQLTMHPAARLNLAETAEGELATSVLYTVHTTPTTEFEDAIDYNVTVKYQDNLLPSIWRLVISRFRYREFDGHRNTRTVYRFEAIDDELVMAQRIMHHVFADVHMETDEFGAIQEVVYSKRRKVFERPVSRRDCLSIGDFLLRSAKRSWIDYGSRP